MKRLVFFFSLVFMSSMVLFAQQERKVKSNAEMSFSSLSHDYGSIVYGADGTYSFKFTNKAQKPIVVTNVKSSCGCTVPSWPKEPIQPGGTGNIIVKYNTKLSGSFNKTVQVFSTAENSPVKLSIRGKVNAKPSDLKSSNNNSNLLNGTKVKAGYGDKKDEAIEEEGMVVGVDAEQKTSGKSRHTTNAKAAKRTANLKKLEAQRKIKK